MGKNGLDWPHIIDAIRDPLMVLDDHRTIRHANVALAAFLGRPMEEIVGRKCYELVHGLAVPVMECPCSRAERSGVREACELEIPERGIWVRATADPLIGPRGRPEGAVHLITDITGAKRAERKAEEESGLLMSLMNNVPGIVYRGLPDWSLNVIGAEVSRVTGYPPEAFLSGTVDWRQVIHPGDLEHVKAGFRRAVAKRQSVLRVEYRIVHTDGNARWIADRRQFVYDSEGHLVRIDGLLLDITERKLAEEKHRAASEKLTALVETSPVPIMAVDTEGTVTLWNTASERVFGWTRGEAVGRFNPIVPEEKRDEFRGLVERAAREGGFSGVEVRRRTKDGTPIDLAVSAAPIRGGDGTVTGVMAVTVDITERKRMEEALRESEERYRRLLDSAPEMIFIQSEGRIVYVNDTGVRTLGASSPWDIIGRSVYDIIHPDDHDVVRDRIRQLDEGMTSVPLLEERFLRLDGTVVEVEVTALPINYRGRPGAQVFVRDISRRKETEKELFRSQAQLRQAQKMEAVGRLAGGVAHDFNNLLTAIRGYTDLMVLRLDEGSPVRKDVEEVQKAGERAADLTRQLLAFSRKQVLQPKVTDLNVVVAGLERMLRRLIGEDVDLVTVLRPDSGRVKVDPGQIEQVILNLVVNARDAMPSGGTITIATAKVELDAEYASRHPSVQAGPHVMLSVTDTGIGMDEETKARLFEPFFTTKEKGKGTGLGLSTVYGIVKQSNGSIWVYSEPGRGTTFKIYFPCVDAAEAAPATGGRSGATPRGRETILLVEDDETVRTLAREILRVGGYQVLDASDGEEAVRIIEEHRGAIDLMVTDVVMPRMGGRQLVERLPPDRRAMKVLYMSGYPDEALGRQGILEPGMCFIEKPFTVDGLLRKIREVLDG